MNWQDTQYNHGCSVHPWVGSPNGFYVDVPDVNGTLNCVFSNRPAFDMNKKIVIRYYLCKISGTPKIVGWPWAGTLPANFRPMLTAGGILDNRWYPSGMNCGFLQTFDTPLQVTIPIKPAFWQDVNGKPATDDPGKFRDVVTHSGGLGIVFGWHSYFAKGVYVKLGKARYGLWDIRLIT